MHGKTNRYAERAGKQTHQYKLKRISQRYGALGLAQHAQHGAVVQVLGRKTACHNRHRNGTEQRRQQRDQIQKFFSAVQRLPHLGAARFK